MKTSSPRSVFNVIVGLLCLTVLALCEVERPAQADDKPAPKFDGKWEATYLEIGGKEQKGGGSMVWVFDKAKATSTSGSDTASFEIKRDDSTDPKRVNFYRPAGDKGLVMRGIYKFDGETLILCVGTDPDDQPGLFQTGKTDGRLLFKMKSSK